MGDIVDAAKGLTEADRAALGEADVFWETFGAMVTLKLPSKSIRLACIMSGFGDGTYSAFALLDKGQLVGMEVEFVKDGHVYGDGKKEQTPMTPEEFLKWYSEHPE
jgi:hypothetical protein